VADLVFAGLQVRAAQQQRSREAQFLLARSVQTPEYMKATRLILSLPDAVTKQGAADQLGHQDALIMLWMGTMESLGILVYRDQLDLELVHDFHSGGILVGWRKLSRWLADFREETQRPTMFEWFEWLADRMREKESIAPPVPAPIAHRDWHASHGNDGHVATP
jgi:hypothetical protein